MIIFNLEGTLADHSHRQHLIDASKRNDCYFHSPSTLTQMQGWYYKNKMLMVDPPRPKPFIPNWKMYECCCDEDKPIMPTIQILRYLQLLDEEIQIWTGRSEWVKEKTMKWINDHIYDNGQYPIVVKMRSVGDLPNEEIFKERWLNESISEGKNIGYVFESDLESIKMFRRRGIFVFDCQQYDKEF